MSTAVMDRAFHTQQLTLPARREPTSATDPREPTSECCRTWFAVWWGREGEGRLHRSALRKCGSWKFREKVRLNQDSVGFSSHLRKSKRCLKIVSPLQGQVKDGLIHRNIIPNQFLGNQIGPSFNGNGGEGSFTCLYRSKMIHWVCSNSQGRKRLTECLTIQIISSHSAITSQILAARSLLYSHQATNTMQIKCRSTEMEWNCLPCNRYRLSSEWDRHIIWAS